MVTLTNGVRLSYAEQGAGPALVLLPGPTDSWRSYAPLMAQLPPTIRAIAVSQRGHGDSDKPPSGYGVADLAGEVPLFLDAVGVERAVVAGHSGAGLVARRVALDDPERVAGLVLLAAPTTLHDNAALEGFVASVVAELTDPVDPDVARALIGDTSGASVPPSFVDDMVTDVLKVPARVWQQVFAGILAYDDTSELHRIGAPVLVVWGDADDLVGRSMQDALVAALPQGELRVAAGLGHSPHWEDARRVATDVVAFVEAVGAA